MGPEAQVTVRMLVLETDQTHPETQDRKGSFGDVFKSLFRRAGVQHDPPLKIETEMHYVVDDPENGHNGRVPKPDEIDKSITAILVTGSTYDAHGDDPWVKELIQLLKTLWQQRPEMRFSGVCFGHQLLCRMLGSEVESTPGGKWELAHTEMDLTPLGQKLFRTDDRVLELHQMHQDQVTTLPDPSKNPLLSPDVQVGIWASTKHTKIQGVYIRARLFTSQGHLGFDERMVKRQIEMRQEQGSIEDSALAEESKERAHLEHDGVVVASAILRFFHGEDDHIE